MNAFDEFCLNNDLALQALCFGSFAIAYYLFALSEKPRKYLIQIILLFSFSFATMAMGFYGMYLEDKRIKNLDAEIEQARKETEKQLNLLVDAIEKELKKSHSKKNNPIA